MSQTATAEIWKTIDEFPKYEVSNTGYVRNIKNKKVAFMELTKKGYLKVRFEKNGKRKMFRISRLVATAFLPNPNNILSVDHIDGNRQNNRLENLRWASHAENGRNRKKLDNCTSKYKGVSLNKKTNKWRPYICVNNKKYHLGTYKDEEFAAAIYNCFAKLLFKEFARLNQINKNIYTENKSLLKAVMINLINKFCF